MEKIEVILQRIENKLTEMDEKLERVTEELRTVKTENIELKDKITKQEQRMESLEKQIRRKNLIIKGIIDEEKEEESITKEKIEIILNKMGIKIDVENETEEIRRIGKFNEGRARPVIIKLMRYNKKIEILKNSNKLKETEIWIDEDYPKEVQEERKQLIPIMKVAREQGQKAQLRYNKLLINNEIYKKGTGNTEKNNEGKQQQKEAYSFRINKRKVHTRSPETNALEEQLRKITKTADSKN